MISFDASSESRVTRIGAAAETPQLQVQLRESRRGASEVLTLEIAGARGPMMDLWNSDALVPGAIALPTGLPVSLASGKKIILESADLTGEVGAQLSISAVYRKRNERETDADCLAGLLSRTVSCRWVERQEMIEHFAARKAKWMHTTFNAKLFALWIDEPDPATKAAYRVSVEEKDEEGNVVSTSTYPLDPADRGAGDPEIPEELRGSTLTKAVAERFAMGVQYAGNRMMQLDVSEIWRVPRTINASSANSTLEGRPPVVHQPLFQAAETQGVTFHWVLAADGEEQVAEGFRRGLVYLGIPSTMTPDPAPTYWGETPVDELVNPVQKGAPLA